MNNDNNDGNILSFGSGKKVEQQKPSPGKFEFHLFPTTEIVDDPGEVVEADGFLKFGPQFVAVVEGPEDAAPVVFAVPVPLLRYVKRVSSDGSVQGTLGL